MENPRTLAEMFSQCASLYPEGTIKSKSLAGNEEDEGEQKETQYVSYTYSELDSLVGRLAQSFRKAEIGSGDKVAVMGDPHPLWAVTFFATQRVGAISVPIASDLTSGEARRILQESETKVMVLQGSKQSLVRENRNLLPQLKEVIVYGGEGDEDGFTSWEDFLSEEELPEGVIGESDRTAAIMYTSGSTGNAKGVMLSHRNLLTNISDVNQRLEIGSTDTLVSILPWYHIYGLTTSLLTPVKQGASTVYSDDYRNLPDIIKENGGTFLLGVPKLFDAIDKEITHEINSNFFARFLYRFAPFLLKKKVKGKVFGEQFRFPVSGGAPLDPETAESFRKLGLGMIEGYGLTETSPVLTMTEDPFTDKPGSVGRPLPNVELKLKEGEDEVKEVLVKGPNVMQGYYKNKKRTEEIIDEDGWFHTGDSGHLDEDGWLYLNGRKKNVIVLQSGKNVYPEEVEWELGRLPFIEEVLVREKKRSGRPVVSAVIYPDYSALEEEGLTGEGEIKDFIWRMVKRGCHNLAVYKRIKSKRDIEILGEPFEKTPTLKVKRYLYKHDSEEAEGNRSEETSSV